MSKIVNNFDLVDKLVFGVLKKKSGRTGFGRFINIKSQLKPETIQEMYESGNNVYITQHNVQYLIKNVSLEQVIIPLITEDDLKIKFELTNIRFFCSGCGGVGALDWIRAIKKIEPIHRFQGKRKKNSNNFLVFSDNKSDFIIRSTLKIEKQDADLINLCQKCKGSGLEPTPGQRYHSEGTLEEILNKLKKR